MWSEFGSHGIACHPFAPLRVRMTFFLLFLFCAPIFAETLDGWEEQSAWRPRLFEMTQAQAEVKSIPQNAIEGKSCLQVRYVFDNLGVDGEKVLAEALVLTHSLEPQLNLSEAKGLSLCVKGNQNLRHQQLNLWLSDPDGDTWIIPLCGKKSQPSIENIFLEKPSEWIQIFIPLQEADAEFRPWGDGHWAGWHQVQSLSFEITDTPNTKFKNSPHGDVLYLDDLRIVRE